MSNKERANLKRQIEELYSEKKRLEQDNKRPKQDNVGLDDLVCNPGLQHVALQIFKQLDPKSLGFCRSVSKSWKEVIDDDKTWWQSLLLEYKSFMIKKIYKSYRNDQLEEFIEAMEYINDNESLENLKLFATFMRVYCRDVKKNLETNDFDSPLHFAADRNRIDIFKIIVRSPMKKMNVENWNQLFFENKLLMLGDGIPKFFNKTFLVFFSLLHFFFRPLFSKVIFHANFVLLVY